MILGNKWVTLTILCLQWYIIVILSSEMSWGNYSGESYWEEAGSWNIESTAGHFDPFSLLLSCSPNTLYAVQFQFTGHSLDLSNNILHDWLFPLHWAQPKESMVGLNRVSTYQNATYVVSLFVEHFITQSLDYCWIKGNEFASRHYSGMKPDILSNFQRTDAFS